ncbi:chitinase domain-containing protein 1-like [Paramacrobiotus metropolitanus]|uniref:chitinase domain-containing protein 1-like n=1 Tax=Paramacrobiotus metropolitanus TaxID=2943436 RepID=UPI0024458FA1|nr:chitinase domain-containing protein 1-like [Paramacrobiotus metropolitanus]
MALFYNIDMVVGYLGGLIGIPDHVPSRKLLWISFACLISSSFCYKSSSSWDADLFDASSLPEDLVEKKLVSLKPDILDILDYHNTTFGDPESAKRVKHFVLGYVTPWNNKGYDRAVKYAKKFTHICPVWLQVVPGSTAKVPFEVRGTHDVDQGWIGRLKEKNEELKIVPRVLLEGFDGRSLQTLMFDEENAETFASVLIATLQQYNLDGAVLEMWKPVNEDVYRRAMRNMIKIVADKLKSAGLQSILVVPPSGGQKTPGRLKNEDFLFLADSIALFSVMTYDHPLTYSNAGPIAPLQWMVDSMESIATDKEKSKRKKLLLGLNHYGYDFTPKAGANAIVGTTFLEHLQKYQPTLEWDAVGREHVYKYRQENTQHVVHFPSLRSLEERITLANRLGTGVAIWDLGQGLDYFFDLL